jgi:short-subunit dehydrogenase
MMSSSGLDAKYHAKHPLLMPVEPCARVALAALVARRRTAIPGLVNRAGALLLRAVPRSWMARAVARDYAPILPARTDTRDDS